MNDLQAPFVDAIDHLDLPDIDLTAAVLDRINADDLDADDRDPDPDPHPDPDPDVDGREDGDGSSSSSTWLPALLGAAAMAAVGLIVATTPVGEAVADWFGIGSTAFEIEEPDDNSGAGGADGLGDAGDADRDATPDLGRQVLPVPDIVPIESLGRPDAVFDDSRRGRTFVWDTGDGSRLRLSARSTAESTLAIKSLASADDVEFLTVHVPNEPGVARPYPAVWVGAPHTLSFPVDGLDLELTVDAGPVLIWVNDDDGVELRLEGAGGRDEAVGYASQVSEGTELLPPG